MLKPFSKYAHVALALALILPLASGPVDAKPSSSSSFKSGFSSQRSSSPSKSFSSPKPSKSSSGGFGSFSSSRAADSQKSDSALSRKLDKERSDANALRTLDERRAAQAARDARDTARPAPDYAPRDARVPQQGNGYGYGYGNAPPPAQPPIIVNNNGGSGLGPIVAGAILARQAANAHANGNHAGNGNGGGYYPAPDGSAGDLASQAGANSVGTGGGAAPAARDSGGSLFGTFVWLCVLSLIGWCVYFAWKRAKARRAANKPNYSFERN